MERLGIALFKQKKFPEAALLFDQLKSYKPDAKTYNYLAESQIEIGRQRGSGRIAERRTWLWHRVRKDAI